MNYTTIQLAYDSRVATITLNRPEKRNAISFELIDDLLRALKEVETSDALVLILTGAGKAFSSGMDLDNLKALIGRSPEQNLQDSETMVRLFRTLYEFPKVTIAAVNGAAIAGGTGLALLCDFTLAVPEASSATPKCASALSRPSFPRFFSARLARSTRAISCLPAELSAPKKRRGWDWSTKSLRPKR